MIPRDLQNIIESYIDSGKIIMVVGARQTGKSTLLKSIQKNSPLKSAWFNADEPDIQDIFSNASSTRLKNILGDNQLILIDEAQKINNIGTTLKLISDTLKNYKVIVSGSSALDLNQLTQEPLTGRKLQFNLYPISFNELVRFHGLLNEKRLLNERLIYGSYPEIINNPGKEKLLLNQLTESYLFQDVLMYGGIKKPEILTKLLRLLALQVGSEVSYHELGSQLGVSNELVEKYISLLEKVFVVFRLPAFSRNHRNEIKKSKKVYFYDNGIMNALNSSFSNIETRKDLGALWENYLMIERKKTLEAQQIWTNQYFWRTFDQSEMDLVEEKNATLFAYEFKWNPLAKKKVSKAFLNTYPNHHYELIHRENYQDFISQIPPL